MKTKKCLPLLVFALLFSSILNAQNLVVNPSFEDGTDAVETTIIPGSYPNLVGLWEFNNTASPLTATVGTDLTLSGSHTTIAGWTAGDNGVTIGAGSYYTASNPTGGNGGGTYTNEYSLLIDFRISSIGSWHSFYQTNTGNGNDGDLWIRSSDGQIGVSSVGYGAEGAIANVWHRMIVSVDNGTHYRIYLDGRIVEDGAVQGVDGRFSLENVFLLFADNDGEDTALDITTVGLFNNALTEADVEGLGRTICDNWNTEGNFQQQFRNGGFASASDGTYYCYAGSKAGPIECFQDIDVSAYAAVIDASTETFTFSGEVQTFSQTPQDNARVIVEYRDAGSTVLDSWDSGNQNTNSVWQTVSDSRLAPVGTRTIRIRIVSTKNNGTSNDAYYDNFSLIPTSFLPVEIVSLGAKRVSADVEISWTTASELNCDYYRVDRSYDGNSWEEVGEIDGNGTSISTINYKMIDVRPGLNQAIYYRLHQFDYNGTESVYGPVSVDGLEATSLNLYPNPAQDQVTLNASSNMLPAQVFVLDATGRIVKDATVENQHQILDLNGLTSGMYTVRLVHLNGAEQATLIKR